jgi:hypothetical protein
MKGPRACLVTKSSATHGRSWEDGPEHTCPIARTHSDMVKFRQHDSEYVKVKERLLNLTRRALVVQRRKQSADAKCKYRYCYVTLYETKKAQSLSHLHAEPT